MQTIETVRIKTAQAVRAHLFEWQQVVTISHGTNTTHCPRFTNPPGARLPAIQIILALKKLDSRAAV